MKRMRIRVGGVVQGVCFRYYAAREAARAGVHLVTSGGCLRG